MDDTAAAEPEPAATDAPSNGALPPGKRAITVDELRPFFRREGEAELEIALTRYHLAVANAQLEEAQTRPNRATRRAAGKATKKATPRRSR